MEHVFRIYGDYNQKYLQSIATQMRDFAETYTNMASGAIRAPSLISPE